MKIRSRAVKAGILASGKVMTGLAGIVSLAVLARVFDRHDYATYRQTLLAYAFVAPLLTMGLPKALYYFLPGEEKRPKAVLAENLLPLAVMGVLFAAFLVFGGNHLLAARFDNPGLIHTLPIIALYPLFLLPTLALPACLMARDQPGRVAIYSFLSRVVMVILIIAAVMLWPNPEAALWATTGGAALAMIPAIIMMYRSCGSSESLLPQWKGSWDQVKYSVPLGVSAMIGAMSMNLDKVIVSSMTHPEKFAVYVNGAMQLPLVGMITGSIAAVILPEMARHFKEGRLKRSHEMWKRAGSKCALIIFPATTFLFAMAPEVMTFLYSSKYVESAAPFRIYLLMLPVSIVRFDSVYMAAGKGGFILKRAVVMLVVNLVLSIWMVRQIGYLGAAVSTVALVYLIAVPYNTVYVKRLMGVTARELLPVRELAKGMAVSVFAAGGAWYAKHLLELAVLPQLVVSGTVFVTILLLGFHITRLLRIDDAIHQVKNLRKSRPSRKQPRQPSATGVTCQEGN